MVQYNMIRSFQYVIRLNTFGIIHKKEYIKMSSLVTYYQNVFILMMTN